MIYAYVLNKPISISDSNGFIRINSKFKYYIKKGLDTDNRP